MPSAGSTATSSKRPSKARSSPPKEGRIRAAHPDAWRGRRVLLTGHTGFQGSWLALWLAARGARVHGLSLPPPTSPSLFQDAGVEARVASHHVVDIRDEAAVRRVVKEVRPEVVFHLAAQPIVRASYEDPQGTFSTNVMGTVNVLEAIRTVGAVRATVVYTTDKCYENREWDLSYREEDPMGGHDPYSASKGAAELVVASYRRSFFAAAGMPLATVRAGNVIGGGDWAKDRLVPDAVRAFRNGKPLVLRHPDAVRPWQHVLDPLRGCILLAEHQMAGDAAASRAFNLGPAPSGHVSVGELAGSLAAQWPGAEVRIERALGPHEARLLRLDATRAHTTLGWSPRLDIKEAIAATGQWYRAHAKHGFDAARTTLAQIRAVDPEAKA